MILTQHFTLDEFINSATAARKGIDNYPTAQIVDNLKLLAYVMESVRSVLGKPITITSGYRCSKLNKEVGSKATSKHVQGLACDFVCPEYGTPKKIVETLAKSNINFDQLILEYFNPATGDGWVHIGLGADPRKQVLTINGYGTFTGVRV